jgi:hypothetical protein
MQDLADGRHLMAGAEIRVGRVAAVGQGEAGEDTGGDGRDVGDGGEAAAGGAGLFRQSVQRERLVGQNVDDAVAHSGLDHRRWCEGPSDLQDRFGRGCCVAQGGAFGWLGGGSLSQSVWNGDSADGR